MQSKNYWINWLYFNTYIHTYRKKKTIELSQFIQNSNSDISDCKTNAPYTIPSYPGLKKRFREKKLSYIMQWSKPSTPAKRQELFPELLYHQFGLNTTILRGTHYNSQLPPFWIDQVHPFYRKNLTSSLHLLSLLWNSFGKTCQIVLRILTL